MSYKNFFHANWGIFLGVGIALFLVSLLIELQILKSFIDISLIALLLACALEIGKAVSIIWHRYMLNHEGLHYTVFMRFVSGTFRIGLVFFSMLCSVLFLSEPLDRPNIESVRVAHSQDVKEQLATSLKQLEKVSAQRLEALQEQQQKTFKELSNDYKARIDKLEQALSEEMNNVVNKKFKGPRYLEINERLKNEKTAQLLTLGKLRTEHASEYESLDKRIADENLTQRKLLTLKAEQDLKRIKENRYLDDESANDSTIMAFLNVMDAVFSSEFSPLQFVFMFSILISVLVELGIVLAFDTITLAALPAMQASHAADIKQDILKTKLDQKQKAQKTQHDDAMKTIHENAKRTLDKAHKYINEEHRDFK